MNPARGRLLAGLASLAMIAASRATAQAAPPPRIVGTVHERQSGEAIAGARITATAAPGVAYTGEDGRFELRLPAGTTAGSTALDIVRIGFKPVHLPGVRIGTSADPVDVVMDRAAVSLSTMVITPGHFGVLTTAPAVSNSVTREEIRTKPQLAEDIYRSVNRLPGISSNELSAKFKVRGGNAEEVLVLLDGLELFEPFHLKDFDGSLSVIDIESIGGVDLTTGGFTSEYGGRLSGVMSMRTLSDSEPGARTAVGASLSNVRARTQGTFAGGRGRWLASGRYGFLELILKMVRNDDNLRPRYNDELAKVEYEVRPGQLVAAHVLRSNDRFGRVEQGQVFNPIPDSLKSQYGNRYGWLTWSSTFNEKLSAQTLASIGTLSWSRHGLSRDNGRTASMSDERTARVVDIKQDWSAAISDRLLLRAGADAKRVSATYDYHKGVHDLVAVDGKLVDQLTDTLDILLAPGGTQLGAYFAPRFRVASPLTVEAGVRYDRNSATGDADVSPRLNASLVLTPGTTLRAAWGRYAQSEHLFEIPVQFGEQTLYRSQLAEHRVVGIERVFRSGFALRVEGYERLLTRVRPQFVSLQYDIEVFPEVSLERVRIDATSGRARGIEVYARRDGQRFSWSGSYALASITDRVGAADVPRVLDQRHTLFADVAYVPSDRWTFSAAAQVHTGWPYTDHTYTLQPLDSNKVHLATSHAEINALRLPMYHRLDLRVTRRWNVQHGRVSSYLDVFNAYDHTNAAGYIDHLRIDRAGHLLRSQTVNALLPILPTLGFTWEF